MDKVKENNLTQLIAHVLVAYWQVKYYRSVEDEVWCNIQPELRDDPEISVH
jgi:hypothetical protein